MNAVDDLDDIDPELDAHIRRTLREVAQRIPGDADERRPPSLVAVRPPQPWPTWAKAAVVVAVAGLLAGAVAVRQEPDDPNVATRPDPALVRQRLFLEPWPGELRPNGSVTALPLGGLDRLGLHGAPQPLPDGRHVALGVQDTSPEDVEGNELTDIVSHLVVADAEGRVEVDREVPRTGAELVQLLAATADEAILARTPRDEQGEPTGPTRIVGHDLETGQERTVDEGFPAEQSEGRALVAGHAVADTLAVGEVMTDVVPGDRSGDGGSCTVWVTDTHTDGSGIADSGQASTPTEPCEDVRGVRLSPGGDLLAFVYVPSTLVPDPDPDLRLAVVDLARSATLHDEVLGCHEPAMCPAEDPVEYLGMAWDNEATLRIALVDLAANPDWNPEGEALTRDEVVVETRTVGEDDVQVDTDTGTGG